MVRSFRLSLLTAIGTYVLIVLGGITRIAASGYDCGADWPLCQGKPYPPLDPLAIAEYLHRPVAAAVALLALATAVVTWITPGASRVARLSATAALGFIGAQLLLGAAGARWELPARISLVHLGLAMLFFAATLLTVVAVASDRGAPAWLAGTWERGWVPPDRGFFWIAASGTAVIFVLILSGGVTRTSGAGLTCDAWPWCTGQAMLPADAAASPDAWIDLSHRAVAIIGALTVGLVSWQAMRRTVSESARRLAQIAVGATLLQLLIGGAYVVTSGSAWLSAAHLAAAALLWAAMVGVTITATRPVAVAAPSIPVAGSGWHGEHGLSGAMALMLSASPAGLELPGGAAAATLAPAFILPDIRQLSATAREYLALTKPGILTLLLATTLGGMIAGAAAIPPFWLVLVTMLGGAMSAGGANTLNCYIDRDIDALMGRTRKRGTVTGAVPPHGALLFGIALTVASVLLFGLFVNWLAALLSLAGNLYYVLVYTKWLKRRTPHNIVIGGAAGAMPPVVGWAAATGQISIAAVLMFAVIYYWTPPHFWALALLKQGEYGRAAVPMLPNVRGEEETRWQVLLYTVMLAAVALMLVPFGMGWIYLIGAVVFNGVFVWYAIRLYRSPSKALARRTFFYSLWYLALLFGAMVADRLILA